jgi:hypothetical protein
VAEVTTAATFEMAELYRTLAKDIMASERPKNLSKDEREQYDSLLEEQVYPFEEQAISLHEANAARAKDGLYDEWVKKSYDVLAELKARALRQIRAVARCGHDSQVTRLSAWQGLASRRSSRAPATLRLRSRSRRRRRAHPSPMPRPPAARRAAAAGAGGF